MLSYLLSWSISVCLVTSLPCARDAGESAKKGAKVRGYFGLVDQQRCSIFTLSGFITKHPSCSSFYV